MCVMVKHIIPFWSFGVKGSQESKSCKSNPLGMSNGRPFDMMSIGKVVQWCSMSQWIQWIHWIHFRCSIFQWTCPMDQLMSNGSIWVDPMDTIAKPSLASEHQFGVFVQWIHCVQWIHWTLCPLDIVSIGHNVQWCLMDPVYPLDKNTKLMLTRQTRFVDCVHWIHADGSIGHPLDPLDMSIEHRKWIQWVHWTPLDNFTDDHHVQWTSIVLL